MLLTCETIRRGSNGNHVFWCLRGDKSSGMALGRGFVNAQSYLHSYMKGSIGNVFGFGDRVIPYCGRRLPNIRYSQRGSKRGGRINFRSKSFSSVG